MKSKKILILTSASVLVVVAIAIYFLNSNSKLPRYIPNSAFSILKINPRSIGRKVDFEDIKKLKSFKYLQNELGGGSKKFSKFLENPKETGMTLSDNFYIFGEKPGETESARVGLVFGVSDENALKNFIYNFAKDEILEYQKSGDLNIYKPIKPEIELNSDYEESIDMKNDFVIVWNKEACLLYYGGDNAVNEAKKILNQSKENSMLSVEAFNHTEDLGGDMSFFLNYREYMKLMYKIAGLKKDISFSENLTKYLENISAADAIIEFNKDNINTEVHQYFIDEKINKDYQLMSKNGLTKENLELISSNGKMLMGLGGMLNMKNVLNWFKLLPDFKSTMEEMCEYTGLTESELENLLDGSFSFALTHLKTKEVKKMVYDFENFDLKTSEFKSSMKIVTKVFPQMTAQIGFQNDKSWQKILNKIESINNGMYSPVDNVISIPTEYLGPINLVYINKKLVISNDEENIKILAKNKKWNTKIDDNLTSLFSNNSGAYFFDLNLNHYGENNIKNWIGIPEESRSFKTAKNVLSEFDNITMSGNNDNSVMKVNFSSGNSHSIVRIFKMIDAVANLQITGESEI